MNHPNDGLIWTGVLSADQIRGAGGDSKDDPVVTPGGDSKDDPVPPVNRLPVNVGDTLQVGILLPATPTFVGTMSEDESYNGR